MKTFYSVNQSPVITLKSISDEIHLYIFGDIHRDAPGCDVDCWKEFLAEAKSNLSQNPHTYFLGMGDYTDFASSSEQKAIKNSGKIHETTMNMLDEKVQSSNRILAKEMAFMRGHLLGLIEGNHSWELSNGQTSAQDLAERLDTICLGWLCHYTLKLQMTTERMSIHMAACHGKAGGKTHGVTINQVGDLKTLFPICSLYVMGHDHQRGTWPTTSLVPIDNGKGIKMKQLEQRLCRSGSFLRGYMENTSSYEIGRLYKPSSLGAIKIIIKLRRKKSGLDGTRSFTYEISSLV